MFLIKQIPYLVCVLLLAGCAAHTVEMDAKVKRIIDSWHGKPLEDLLDENPDIQNPIPIGNNSFRYTYLYDVITDAEVAVTALSKYGGRDDFYHLYFYVNQDGIIYKVDYSRRSRTW